MVKFSIITVTRNAAATLDQAIASVASQRCRPHEYIIIDGASTDATAAIVDRHRDTVTRFVSEPDHGIYDAMNKGLAGASGDFVYFLGADDYLVDDEVLADVAAFLDEHPDTDLAYGGIGVRLPDGRTQEFMPPSPPDALGFMICGCLPHQASFASRRAFALAGTFDARYRIAGDYDWFLRVLTQPELVTRRVSRIVASYRMDGMSNRLAESQREAYAIQNALPLYRGPDWMERRLQVFRRELLSQKRRGAVLADPRGAQSVLGNALSLGRLVVAHEAAQLLALFRSGWRTEPRLMALQQELLARRIANDAMERRASQAGQS